MLHRHLTVLHWFQAGWLSRNPFERSHQSEHHVCFKVCYCNCLKEGSEKNSKTLPIQSKLQTPSSFSDIWFPEICPPPTSWLISKLIKPWKHDALQILFHCNFKLPGKSLHDHFKMCSMYKGNIDFLYLMSASSWVTKKGLGWLFTTQKLFWRNIQ